MRGEREEGKKPPRLLTTTAAPHSSPPPPPTPSDFATSSQKEKKRRGEEVPLLLLGTPAPLRLIAQGFLLLLEHFSYFSPAKKRLGRIGRRNRMKDGKGGAEEKLLPPHKRLRASVCGGHRSSYSPLLPFGGRQTIYHVQPTVSRRSFSLPFFRLESLSF